MAKGSGSGKGGAKSAGTKGSANKSSTPANVAKPAERGTVVPGDGESKATSVEPEVDRTTLDEKAGEGTPEWQGEDETDEEKHQRAVLGR